jgi:hypothetical protein
MSAGTLNAAGCRKFGQRQCTQLRYPMWHFHATLAKFKYALFLTIDHRREGVQSEYDLQELRLVASRFSRLFDPKRCACLHPLVRLAFASRRTEKPSDACSSHVADYDWPPSLIFWERVMTNE